MVLTDAMEMLPIWDVYGFERGIIKAIKAGCDILLFCNESGIVPYSDDRAPAAVQVILDAIERGEISEERINRSCARILALKARRHQLVAARSALDGSGSPDPHGRDRGRACAQSRHAAGAPAEPNLRPPAGPLRDLRPPPRPGAASGPVAAGRAEPKPPIARLRSTPRPLEVAGGPGLGGHCGARS